MSSLSGRSGSRCVLGALGALSTAAAVHAQPSVLYVDASAPAGGTGSSWTSAFRDLQDALALAKVDPNPAKAYDVRVAQGVYRPDRGTHNRAMTFLVASGMSLHGGYGGLAAADPDQRDPSVFVSVLSGDLNGDDGAGFVNTGENSFNVVTVTPVVSSPEPEPDITLDGVTIQGGNGGASSSGSGLYIANSSCAVDVVDCTIRSNQSYNGGGVYALSQLTIRHSVIDSNKAINGGGGISGTYLVLNQTTVSHNSTSNFGGGGISSTSVYGVDSTISENASTQDGGGIQASYTCDLTRCIVAGNSAARDGGGIRCEGYLGTFVKRSLIANNFAANGGGIAQNQGYLAADNSTIVANSVSTTAAAMKVGGNGSIFNSIVAYNSAPGGSVGTIAGGSLSIQRSLVLGGLSGFSPTNLVNFDSTNINADPQFVDRFGTTAGVTAWRDKNYRLRATSPAVDAADTTSYSLDEIGTDVAGKPWPVEIPAAPNTGFGVFQTLDLGAYETQPLCRADFDGSGVVAIDDIFVFLNFWFSHDVLADFDGIGGISIDDIFVFLNAWFRGC